MYVNRFLSMRSTIESARLKLDLGEGEEGTPSFVTQDGKYLKLYVSLNGGVL